MYNNESFDDYIRGILGYPNINNSMYINNMQNNNIEYSQVGNEELEECYPEIYKIIYPMVTQRCSRVTTPITKEMIDEMTDEIYSAIEVNNEINLNINLTNETTNYNRSEIRNTTKENKTIKDGETENRGENRQFRNNNLSDLIRILLIRELIGRPGFSQNRPPRPGRPPFFNGRPPFQGGGPRPVRPPMMPREFGNNMDIYEDF